VQPTGLSIAALTFFCVSCSVNAVLVALVLSQRHRFSTGRRLLVLRGLCLGRVRFGGCVGCSGLSLLGRLIFVVQLILQGLDLLLLGGEGVFQRLNISGGYRWRWASTLCFFFGAAWLMPRLSQALAERAASERAARNRRVVDFMEFESSPLSFEISPPVSAYWAWNLRSGRQNLFVVTLLFYPFQCYRSITNR